MIISCRQCRTKFRFDDALMEEEGIWMRCSRCQHVFFQDSPRKIEAELEPEANLAFLPTEPVREETGEPEVPKALPVRDEDVARFLDDVTDVRKTLAEDIQLDGGNTRLPLSDSLDADADSEMIDKSDLESQMAQLEKSTRKRKSRIGMIVLWVVLVIVVIPALVYFLIFPQMGERYVRLFNQYIGKTEQARTELVAGQVKLQDIRQRIVNNFLLGNIRVVEGTAINQSDFSISRIMIKGEIVDAYAVVLGERLSYAGNGLSDEELVNSSEEEILRKLSQPEGRNNVNDRIVPNGQIPFMIVFTKEPAGVIKTTVMITGAERLL